MGDLFFEEVAEVFVSGGFVGVHVFVDEAEGEVRAGEVCDVGLGVAMWDLGQVDFFVVLLLLFVPVFFHLSN